MERGKFESAGVGEFGRPVAGKQVQSRQGRGCFFSFLSFGSLLSFGSACGSPRTLSLGQLILFGGGGGEWRMENGKVEVESGTTVY